MAVGGVLSEQNDPELEPRFKTIDELLEEMDKEDTPLDDDDEDSDDEMEEVLEEERERVQEVMDADTNKDTRQAYWNSQRRFVLFLYHKGSGSNKKKGIGDYRILHPELKEALDNVPRGKGVVQRLNHAAFEHVQKASPTYQPISLDQLKPLVFVQFLMSLTDTANKVYMKSYGGHRSALTYLFTRCKVTATAGFLQDMKRAMRGLKNSAASARGAAGAKLGEGKDPMPFEVYRAICTWLIEDGKTESIFAHCFLTMTWNLMCRSKNTVKVRLEHIGWHADALTVQFAHSKTDQVGNDSGYMRHIYANPKMPEISAVLSLARYRTAFPSIDAGKLFPGARQYDRFRKILGRVVTEHADEIRRLGVDPKNLGVHSIRKGAATYATSGTTAGVNFAAVCVRAGWSMGGVKDRYLQWAAAGDQVCGRTVAGLDVNSHAFAVSPPFFKIDPKAPGGQDLDKSVDEAIKATFGTVLTERMLLGRYLLASLLYHRDWMLEHVDRTSRSLGSIIFRSGGDFDEIHNRVELCWPWTNDQSMWRITFTGLTPAVRNFCYHKEQLELLQIIPTRLIENIKELLDQRSIGGGTLSIDDLKAALTAPIMQQLGQITHTISRPAQDEDKSTTSLRKTPEFRSNPMNYRINSKLSCLAAWLNWHLGEELKDKTRTSPWKRLDSKDLASKGTAKEKATARKTLSNLRYICGEFDKAAGLSRCSTPDAKTLSTLYLEKDSPVQQVLESVAYTKTGRRRRLEEVHWETLAVELAKKDGSKDYDREKRRKRKLASPTQSEGTDKPAPRKKAKSYKEKSSPSKKPSKAKRKKKESESSKKKSFRSRIEGGYRVEGPLVKHPSKGALTVDPIEISWVSTQGMMISLTATDAYLSRLSRKFYKFGVRRSESDFVPMLWYAFNKFGTDGAWEARLDEMNCNPKGSHEIDWKRDPLIFIQVFVGPQEAGHWSLLVCDRTRHKPGILVFFDSLPSYREDTLDRLQTYLANSPLVQGGTKWIRATMPQQAKRSNDCGIWMCIIASAYVKSLLKDGILREPQQEENPDISRDIGVGEQVVNEVELVIAESSSALEVGALGHAHMIETYRTNCCSIGHDVFDQIELYFS